MNMGNQVAHFLACFHRFRRSTPHYGRFAPPLEAAGAGMAQCTCAFRLAHFNSAYMRGGAIKSRCGEPPGRGHAADKEAVIAGYLGLGASRGDLPAEHKDLEHCHPGFGADAELEVRSSAPSRPTMPVRTRCPPRLQVMRQLRGIDCSPLQKSTAWKMLGRQLGKLPPKFHGRAAEVAEKFSMHAYNSLTPSAQLEHSWCCTACPQDALTRELFGTAVLHGNPRGECLAAPPCTYVHCASVRGCHRQICGASLVPAARPWRDGWRRVSSPPSYLLLT